MRSFQMKMTTIGLAALFCITGTGIFARKLSPLTPSLKASPLSLLNKRSPLHPSHQTSPLSLSRLLGLSDGPGSGYYYCGSNDPAGFVCSSTDPEPTPEYYVDADTYTVTEIDGYGSSSWSVYLYTGGGTPPNWFNYGGYCSFQISSGQHLCLSTYDISNSTTYYVQFTAR